MAKTSALVSAPGAVHSMKAEKLSLSRPHNKTLMLPDVEVLFSLSVWKQTQKGLS